MPHNIKLIFNSLFQSLSCVFEHSYFFNIIHAFSKYVPTYIYIIIGKYRKCLLPINKIMVILNLYLKINAIVILFAMDFILVR